MYRFYCMIFFNFITITMFTSSIFTSQQSAEQLLYNAIKGGDLHQADKFLKRQDLNFDFIDSSDKATCVECAIKYKQSGILYNLLQKNIDVNMQHNQSREAPLHHAVHANDESIVGLLLQHKDISLDCRDTSSLTPLQLASMLGYVRVADMIRFYKDTPIKSVSSSERFSTFSNLKSPSNFEQSLLGEQKNKEMCGWFWMFFN